MFYDLHIHSKASIGEHSAEEIADMAKRLGINSIGIANYADGSHAVEKKYDGVEIINVIIIKPKDAEDLSKTVRKYRGKTEVIMVHGGDYDINRAACENSMVDVLCHPELNRSDSGLDHICAKAAHDNNVAIEINFREIMDSYKMHRVRVMNSIRRNIMLCKEYKAPAITTSGAISIWGLRPPRELAAMTNVLGLDLGMAIASVSDVPEKIISDNRQKLQGKLWDGVKIVD